MHYGQNRGKQKKRKLSKKPKLNENKWKFIKFAEIWGKFINFAEIGGICIMHH